jgi:hypothetical protein
MLTRLWWRFGVWRARRRYCECGSLRGSFDCVLRCSIRETDKLIEMYMELYRLEGASSPIPRGTNSAGSG